MVFAAQSNCQMLRHGAWNVFSRGDQVHISQDKLSVMRHIAMHVYLAELATPSLAMVTRDSTRPPPARRAGLGNSPPPSVVVPPRGKDADHTSAEARTC